MRKSYAIFHVFVHISTPLIIYYIFNLSFENFLIIFLSTFLIDLDHLFYFRRFGVKHWISTILEFSEPKKFPLHNLYLMIVYFAGCFLLLTPYFLIGLIFLVIFLHMVWDLFEDIMIFKMGIKHWL